MPNNEPPVEVIQADEVLCDAIAVSRQWKGYWQRAASSAEA